MKRTLPIMAAVICLASASGCGGLGWYRAAGGIPGVAASDYAFYDFCGASSQVYQFSPLQVESSALEALGDLGFKVTEPPVHAPRHRKISRSERPLLTDGPRGSRSRRKTRTRTYG